MPAPQRTTKSHAANVAAPKPRAPKPRAPPPPPSRTAHPTLPANKRPASCMTTSVVSSQLGKRPRPPSSAQPRNESTKGATTTPRTAPRPPRRTPSPVAGLPASNELLDPPTPAVSVTSFSLGGGRIVNSSPAPSSSFSNSHVPPLSSPPPSELGSVASINSRRGPRSSLHSGDLSTASVLETFKRLLARQCYKISPFISPGEDMWDIIHRLWPEANKQKGLNVDFNLYQVENLKYIKNAYHSIQSSWILTARNNIADLYDLNVLQNDSDRLSLVNELLLDHAFIYRDVDQKLPKERRIAPFSASQISRFIHRHFFNKARTHNVGLHDWLLDEQPPPLIVYAVTALHHALQEWRKNGGVPPAKPSPKSVPQRSAGWTYFFNLKNDGASYSTFMAFWNGLPPAMRQKAIKSIRNALKAEIKANEPANDVIPVTDPTPVPDFDPDLLAAYLAEPDPEEVDLRPLVIPRATEDGIVNEGPVASYEGSCSEVDDGHLGDGNNGSEADREDEVVELSDDLDDEGSCSEVDDGHHGEGSNGSETDRDEEADEQWE